MDILTYVLAKKYTDQKIEASHVSVDSELSETSTNPVQNSVIAKKIKDIVSKLVSDKTLKISGGFADAKTVGDKITAQDTKISSYDTTIENQNAVIKEVDDWKDATESRITQLEGSGKVLPAVTAKDAGKYLRVNADGSWEVASISKLGDIT